MQSYIIISPISSGEAIPQYYPFLVSNTVTLSMQWLQEAPSDIPWCPWIQLTDLPRLTIRPKKKNCLVVLHHPLQVFEILKKSFYCTKEYLPNFWNSRKRVFFSSSKVKLILNMSKQLPTLLDWFKELMKGLISKIAPWNRIRPNLNGYNVV